MTPREIIAAAIRDSGRAISYNKALFVIAALKRDGYVILPVAEAQAIRDEVLEEAADIADARRAAWMDAAHSRSQPPYPLPTHFQTERAGEAEFLASAIRAMKGAKP